MNFIKGWRADVTGDCYYSKWSKKFDKRPHRSLPPKMPLPLGIRPPPNTRFLGPTRVYNPNGTSIGSAVFVGLAVMPNRETDSHTDHATSIAIGRLFAFRAYDCHWEYGVTVFAGT